MKMAAQKVTAQGGDVPLFRAGAEDPLPPHYLWFEGDGYWIYAADQPPSSWRLHTHDCTQVCVGLDTRATMEWRTGSPSLQHYREASGNLVAVIPSGEPHRSVWQRRASKVNIYLCEHFLSAIASRVLPETRFELEAAHLVRDPFIEELGRAVYREYVEGAGHDLDRRFADSVADVLAMHLLRVYNARTELPSDSRGQLGPATSRRVRKYIEQYLEGDLSIETLAKVSGLSPNYFAEGFRRTTGFTPHHYVSRRRVDRARQLLIEDTALPLIDVAHRCGFKSQSQFTIVFRRITGVTPGKFRAGHATV